MRLCITPVIRLVVAAILFVGVLFYWHFSGGHLQVMAQVSTAPTFIVYVENPAVGEPTIPTLHGQALFTMRVTGHGVDQIETISFVLLEDEVDVGTLECSGAFVEAFRWNGHCDTMGYPNGEYTITPYMTMRDHQVAVLLNASGTIATFGPVVINNMFTVARPAVDGAVVSGYTPIEFEATGELASVTATITSRDTNAVTDVFLTATDTQPNNYSKWQGTWDAAGSENGDYHIAFDATSFDGIVRERLVTRSVTVQQPTSCAPHMTCGAWSVCGADTLQQTRTCHDGCGAYTTETQDCTDLLTSPAVVEDASSIPPAITLIQPAHSSIVSGQTVLRATTAGTAHSVVFFYRRAGTAIDIRIGAAQASPRDHNVWGRLWNTNEVPNGAYYVFARVIGADGFVVMSDSPVGVIVQNDEATSTPSNMTPPSAGDFGAVDSDGDFLTDDEEGALGTDVNNPDTNRDGMSDATRLFGRDEAAVRESLDRLVSIGRLTIEQANDIRSRLDGSFLEQPTQRGIESPDTLRITKIENNFPRIGETQLVIRGIGPADTYITLFIYSNPIVVTTKTDASGNFTYTLDSDLLDGQHEIYVTITDETGKIREKSSPFSFFVRQAQAVSEAEYLRGDVNVERVSKEPIQNFVRLAVIIILSIIAALGIGWLVKQRSKSEQS